MIVLVRHGRTEANAEHRLLGRLDSPLDETGRVEAAALAAALGDAELIVSSPLGRARETAAVIAGGGEVVVDERWVEIDYGAWDGRPLADVSPDEWDQWRRDPDFAPPGGESLVDVSRRVGSACEDLVADGRTVVVVSHVSPVKAAVAWAMGASPEVAWNLWVGTGTISRIGPGPMGPVLRSFNESPRPAG